MKTAIKNLFAATLTLVVLTSSAFASSTVKESNVTVLTQVKNINKIVVSGNVEVILVQAPTESVKVYDSYYAKNALVQQENGVLRISSFQKETLTVAVYVRDLTSIEATDNATVKTYGKVNFLSLNVTLKGNAKADIKASTVSLYTAVNDHSSIKLSGSTTEYYALIGAQAKMNMDQFTADTTSVNMMAPVYAKVKANKVVQTLESIIVSDELGK